MNAGSKKFRPVRVIIAIILALLLIVVCYVAYVILSYKRIPDGQQLAPEGSQSEPVRTGQPVKIVSYNIGFGAYEPDYSFFMDGGTESWAWSKERLEKNISSITEFAGTQNADILLLQEVDENATRTYHFNEKQHITDGLSNYDSVYARNWNSAFLFYPLTQPHGKTQTGILTLSKYDISGAERRSLPVETSLMKLVDLDRCYSISRIPTDNGKELVLVNVHLSAYTSDGKIAEEQLKILLDELTSEYEKGNYIVCGGDFNKDLLGDSSKYFGIPGDDYTWAQPIPPEMFDGRPLTLSASSNAPTSRIADAPYNPEQFVITLDGFITSDNVKVLSEQTIDTQFAYSDHNPVEMQFILE